MIRFLFVLGNFLEDPSVNHFCDVGILIKDYPQYFLIVFSNVLILILLLFSTHGRCYGPIKN